MKTVMPNLAWYDWIVVNTSAGKDSQAMLDRVCRLAEGMGLLDRVVAVHCDLGEEEWAGTRELAEEQAKHYGVRFEVVKRKQGGILQHVLDRHQTLTVQGKDETPPWMSSEQRWCTSDHKRGQVATLFTKLATETRAKGTPPWPSNTARWCTSHHKTDQVKKLMTSLAREKKGVRPARILNCMGMRAGESCAREKLKPFKLDRAASGSWKKVGDDRVFVFSSRRVVHTWLPLHNWSVEDVWNRIEQAGTRKHYAYDLGMPRLSCVFCIFSPRNALLLAGKHNRELLDRYCEVEQKTGFAFRKELPLVDIRAALDRGEEPGPIRSWEMP